MSSRRTISTARRVLAQLRHDPRTIALLLVVPAMLMTLLSWILDDANWQRYAPGLLGIFPMLVMFLVTSVATLRERTGGTLERLLSMPMSKADFVFGYALAFGVIAAVQGIIVGGLCFTVLGLSMQGPTSLVLMVAVLDGLLGTAMGLFVSAFAQTEFQAVQFMPVALLPQFLLCGLIVPTDQLPSILRFISALLPLTYAFAAMQKLAQNATVASEFWVDVVVLIGMAAGLLAAGTATLRRRTA
ncbi:MAG: ABC transporter permease [Actinomycetes bacterium]|jgi:ABC-2 type transport system permease protein